MAEELDLIYNASLYNDADNQFNWMGSASVWISPPQTMPNYTSVYDGQVNNWALVLDRNDPTKPALFNAPIEGNTEPPAALSALMTAGHILIFMCAGTAQNLPQGNLFKMLQDNGAGSSLKKLETLAYFNGSGMIGSLLYTLVSLPSAGLTGIEHMTTGESGRSTYPNTDTFVSIWSKLSSVMKLVPSDEGYVPVEIA